MSKQTKNKTSVFIDDTVDRGCIIVQYIPPRDVTGDRSSTKRYFGDNYSTYLWSGNVCMQTFDSSRSCWALDGIYIYIYLSWPEIISGRSGSTFPAAARKLWFISTRHQRDTNSTSIEKRDDTNISNDLKDTCCSAWWNEQVHVFSTNDIFSPSLTVERGSLSTIHTVPLSHSSSR